MEFSSVNSQLECFQKSFANILLIGMKVYEPFTRCWLRLRLRLILDASTVLHLGTNNQPSEIMKENS